MRSLSWTPLALLVGAVVGCGGGSEAVQAAPQPKADRAPAKEMAAPAAPVQAEPEPELAPPLPKTPASYADALERARALQGDHRETLLCGCRYSDTERVSPSSCGYLTRADEQLAKHVAWAHLVPPHDFGSDRACWTQPLCTDDAGNKYGGIECCQASDPQFAAMRTDLFNLVPLVGEVARDKSNYVYAELPGEAHMYGGCDLEIDRDDEAIEPRPEVRGDVARVYLYFADTYPGALVLSAREKLTFRAWAAEDPPSEWEIERARAISALQGVTPHWLEVIDATAKAAAGQTPPVAQPPVDAAPLPAGQVAG